MKTATLGTSTAHISSANAHNPPEMVMTRGVLSRVRRPTNSPSVGFTNAGCRFHSSEGMR